LSHFRGIGLFGRAGTAGGKDSYANKKKTSFITVDLG
jgi:hypothetical protein